MELVKRPSFGNVGRTIKVRTNFFEVITFPKANIIHYDVTITPEVPPRLNRKVFQRFVETNLRAFKPVYDGKKNIFVDKLLPFEDESTFDVELEEDRDAPVARTRPPQSFNIKLKKVGEIVMKKLIKFLNAESKLTEDCLMAITALDVLIRHEPSIKYTAIVGRIDRSFYTSDGAKSLSGGLEAWQGFYQSARPTYGRMMINIDLCATAFYEEGPLIQLITKILGCNSPSDLRSRLSNDKDRQKVERIIKGLRIKDNHRPGNQRKFKIEKLTKTPASHTMFDKDGTQIDVQTYFLNDYNKRLNYHYLPCVVVRKDAFLPLELCDVIKGQRYTRKLDKKQTADMLKFTCQNPISRANKIRTGLSMLNYQDNEYLQHFGMRISNDMTVVDARVLPTPTIQYRNQKFKPKLGVWNLRDKRVATGATLNSWSVVSFKHMPKEVIKKFIEELVVTCQHTGMNIPNKNPPISHGSPQGDIEATLKKAWVEAGNEAKAQPQLILCILPNDGVQLYAEIKRVTDTIIGVASQCVQSDHTRRPNKQYCANVCLKINVKLGGMNSFVIPEEIPFISDRPTILMGADVTHFSPSDRRPSIAALCGSLDIKASRYAASISLQEARTEIIADLENMVKECLKAFYQNSGRKPERILFYRDGVSEGEFSHVLDRELNAIKAACQSLEANYKPTVTFVVAQKRHHTRFFPMDRNNADEKTGNCLPGTVVEKSITHPFEFDFYLQSHPGLQGTSRPTHYHVLYDQNGFNSDKLQVLSYNLCYLYARCTRAVSLVPPVYYAHIICARARFHSPLGETESSEEDTSAMFMFGEVKPNLRKAMYYI